MKVYIDVNIIMDWATQREPFAKNANAIMHLAKKAKFEAYTSPLGMAMLFYLLRKERGKQATYEFIQECQTFIKYIDNPANAITLSIDNPYRDFEDDLHYYSALENGIKMLVTRNTKDFTQTDKLQILTPDELLYELGY